MLGPAAMDIISFTQYTTVPLAFILQLLTAVFIVQRKQLRTFPLFFAYTIFHIIETATSFVAFRISYVTYFYTYWTGEMLDTIFTLAVIQEVFLVTFQPYEALRRWGSRIYVAGTVLLLGSAVFMGVTHPMGYSPRVSVLYTLDRSAIFVQIGLLFFLFLFCRLFGMTWRHYVFGIAFGYVLVAGLITISEAIRTRFGVSVHSLVSMLDALAYTIGAGVWTYYFASSKSRVPLDRVPGTEKLIAWNRALGEIGRR
jgi:hypothetical protein